MDYSRCLVPQGAGKWVVTRKGFQGAAWGGVGGAGQGRVGRGGARKQEEQWPGHGRKQLLDFMFKVLTWAHSDYGR